MNHLITYASLLLMILLSEAVAQETSSCIQCHAREVVQWQASQHARSLQPANQDNVLGDFDHTPFVSKGIKAEFYQEAGTFKVKLTEADQTRIWTLVYTLGVYPLQQYLIDSGDGKLQALNIAWDSRSSDAGGQRWFRLDDPDHSQPGDPLHWQGVYQNWNGMCADCHSTGFGKHYMPDEDRYRSRFDQVNVSCSACHHNAPRHAQAAHNGESMPAGADMSANGAWLTGTLEHKPEHTGPTSSAEQVETCGRCHALRTRLDQSPAGQINDQYRLTRLQSPLYYPDGRVREEVFVLGSFMQSRMHHAGVVCSNCHNPHSGKPVAEGNELCGQCHAAANFDNPQHHHHQQGSSGAACVGCHMPERTYMKVDPRREHNFTTPSPITSQRAGSPDPCLACHTDKSRDWSIKQVIELWPDYRERSHWFEIQQADLPAMLRFITDQENAALHRASLLEQQSAAIAESTPELILDQLSASNPLMRESGWKAAAKLPASALHDKASTGLRDPSLSVRLAAFESLMVVDALPSGETGTRVEYEAYLDQQSDRPAGRTLRGRYRLISGAQESAEQDFQVALRMDHAYLPAYMLLTELLRSQQRFDEAVVLLTRGLDYLPLNANLLHLRGLTLLQVKRYERALDDLEKAADLLEENWLFNYRYALALLRLGQVAKARKIATRLELIAPDNLQVEVLIREIGLTTESRP
ncbi:cytochrome c3 family protein [Marinobacterium sediminicola]|uniref:Doubled CXXCH motif (Paired_CXXCH_1) n=1 Tax=Marinobacterium sediminicola TaxID=518898 RepID=A0ABY1S3C2_9GAMM|nr:cytochrome c3 family protein [Marinobacterium sediminicola]ULG68262.1 tetratricopeptide repeat protein [Marinobacterium sediminicola]SMR77768.1 Doubled CXXCH motif (Paired_CXXCH_1) [Marinobacterium sediminicola]